MSRLVGILMLGLCACDADPGLRVENTSSTPPSSSACERDGDCGDGLLCEACGDGFKTCVPGCREDAQCGPNMLCNHNVQCLSCPCPSGWCDLDPCRDLDGDGFAAALEGECPGKQVGDCNDGLAFVKPGGTERCANGQDDDCNGKKDRADPACRESCDQGRGFCSDSRSCRNDEFCERGCCEQCPATPLPSCDAGQVFLAAGLDDEGCTAPMLCFDAARCAGAPYELVCARNFASYSNRCEVAAAGSRVLHEGGCVYREGEPCEEGDTCSGNAYCRNLSEDGGVKLRCALRGTCSIDADCAHLRDTTRCADGGVPAFTCQAEKCVTDCG